MQAVNSLTLRGLQEVQSTHYENFLLPELEKHGYTAIYKKKTTELFTANKYSIDGCATFFRQDRFAQVKKYEVSPHEAPILCSTEIHDE